MESHAGFPSPLASADKVTPSSQATHNVAMASLRQWEVFENASDTKLRQVRAFYSFNVPPHITCSGGSAIIFLTNRDEAYGVGHNCRDINILGFSSTHPAYRREVINKPLKIPGLSFKRIQQMSVGGLIGAAISECGTLFWWGLCYNKGCEIMPPHSPRSPRRQYIRVSCGHRFMAAVSQARQVYVWGQLVHNTTKYLDGGRLIIDFTVSKISCGVRHVAMLDVEGFVYTWGQGEQGQRGVADYSATLHSGVTKIMESTCIDVKCGPFSTFCLTAIHELKACGWNHDHHLGHLSRYRTTGNAIPTPTKISLFAPVSDFELVWTADYGVTMFAKTNDSGIMDLYTWGAGSSIYPTYSGKESFFDVFTSRKLTPGLITVKFSTPTEEFELAKKKNKHIARLVSDALVYIYLRDRPDLSREATQFLWKCRNHHLTHLVNRMPCEISGKDFIITKFIDDLRSKPQIFYEEGATYECYSSEQGDSSYSSM